MFVVLRIGLNKHVFKTSAICTTTHIHITIYVDLLSFLQFNNCKTLWPSLWTCISGHIHSLFTKILTPGLSRTVNSFFDASEMLQIVTLLLYLRVTQPSAVCDGNWDFESAGPPAIKYLFSPDWSEAAKTGISGFLGNQCFWEKAARFSLLLFYHPLTRILSSSSVSHLLSCRHALYAPLQAAYFSVCFCVMHTNVWHYDMIAQCNTPPPPKKKKKTLKNNKKILLFDPGVKTEWHARSCLLLKERKPRVLYPGLLVNHLCSLILIRHHFKWMATDDDSCERRPTSHCHEHLNKTLQKSASYYSCLC